LQGGESSLTGRERGEKNENGVISPQKRGEKKKGRGGGGVTSTKPVVQIGAKKRKERRGKGGPRLLSPPIAVAG